MRNVHALCLVVAALAACRKTVAEPSTVPPGSPSAGPPSLVIASERGIEILSTDDMVRRVLTATPARHARQVPGTRDLLFLAAANGELRRLALDDGREEVVVILPDHFRACDTNIPAEELDVQDPADFAVDKAGGLACLTLMDRNVNMVEVAAELVVDLAKRSVRHRTSYLGEECDKTPTQLWPACHALAREAAKPRAARYHVEDGLFQEDGRTVVKFPADDYSEEAVSPSGRWVVVTGNLSEGDYIHRNLYVLDREAGRLFAVKEGPWPAEAEQPEAPGETLDVVGESDIWWVEGRDLLVVDAYLVIPGQRTTFLSGDVTAVY